MKLSAQLKVLSIGMICLICIIFFPLAGYLLAGKPLGPILAFPPQTKQVGYPPFSWGVFIGITLFVLSVCLPFAKLIFREIIKPVRKIPKHYSSRKFPNWGWYGVVLLAASWILAWNRFSWFAPLQAYTFFPIWLGYIIIVNALIFRRQGICPLLSDRAEWIWLFGLSSFFWWGFEYLNRFVRNWHYLGVEDFSPAGYFIHASLCFSTVLPAVLATEELVSTYVLFQGVWGNCWRPPRLFRFSLFPSWGIFLFAIFSLTGIGLLPNLLYPFLWISPLLLLSAIQAFFGEKTIFSGGHSGDWGIIGTSALAGLICGFFWELWNYHSFAHWVYTVPYVERFHFFAMPLIGYAGYIPFGVTCVAVSRFFLSKKGRAD